MCGIAGYFLPRQQADLADVCAMCDRIRHRGPDDEGFHIDGGCALGMRRLSIIDLNTGHQPISNEDGSLWVVFNGEIYNNQELRQDLISKGHRFKTNTDTETLLHLYEQEGVEGIRRLRGMFAYAIWDARRQSLLLARDRFGKKPLYYSVLPQGIYFGSELKCLRAAGVPLDTDAEALRLYLQFGYIPDPWSVYRSVRKFPPGGWMIYHADGKVEEGRYWKLPMPVTEPAPGFTEDEACERLRETFDESVRLRMIADVPLGAFLSGGIDSSLVVASMARQSSEPVKTFSIGFEEAEFNELPFAVEVARQYKTDHHEIVVHPDSLDLVTRMVHLYDEPFGDSSCIPTFLVSEFAVQHVKVCLSGDGGDELFGGYESFFNLENQRWVDGLPLWVRGSISAAADLLPYSAYGKNYLRMISRRSAVERYFENHTAPHFLRRELLNPDWILPEDPDFLHRTFPDQLLPDDSGILAQAMYFEATAQLTGDMLVKVDRASMANSLEVRCPLLDQELADLAARVPHRWKIQNGSGKRILIKALGDRLPPGLLQRKKKGFGLPLSIWFRGPLREFLWDHLTSVEFQQRGIVQPEFVKAMLQEHQSGRRDNSTWLWRLLMLELWFRQFEDSSSTVPEIASFQPQCQP
jgi:asparagine synthase (glutamine-hydrolysing)